MARSNTAELLRASAGAGGIPTGTSMPVAPATNDRFFRTDLALEFFYDGARWLSMMEVDTRIAAVVNLGTIAQDNTQAIAVRPDFDIYVTKFFAATYIATTNTGTAFWTFKLQTFTSAGVAADIANSSFNTSADSASTTTSHIATGINAAIHSATFPEVVLAGVKTGAPGNVYGDFHITYRLIGV